MSSSDVVSYRLPCPHYGCSSSDAFHLYSDGHGFCFSCSKPWYPDNYGDDTLTDDDYSMQYMPWRGITADSFAKYDVQTKVAHDGTPVSIAFPYGRDRAKVRSISAKSFVWVGTEYPEDTPLFGQSVFNSGSHKYIVVTEGELDAISVYQILNGRSASVSVTSAVVAERNCKAARDYLNSFERIYLCFDNDEPGNVAKAKVARLFDYNKVYDLALTKYKDANEYLSQEGGEDEFRDVFKNARKFQPEGIVSTLTDIVSILKRERKASIASYPFTELQRITGGIRSGERVLLTALEGIGKTEYVRAIEHSILGSTDLNLGIIHLEEPQERSIRGLIGYELGVPTHLSSSVHSVDELTTRWQGLVKRDERVHFYSHFGSSDPNVILDRIRFMVAVLGCRIVTLDHISMVVSGLGDSKERENLDYISTRLAMMTNELDFALIFVSHVNDEGLTRGSRNISKIADLWVHITRDHLHDDELVRNTSTLTVKKNRFTGLTGYAGKLYFNPKTFMLSETPYEPDVKLPPVNT